MGKPAARQGDVVVCPHGTAPLGATTTGLNIEGATAVQLGQRAACAGPGELVVTAAKMVTWNGIPLARFGEHTSHGGSIVTGASQVFIGGPTTGGTTGKPARARDTCQALAAGRENQGTQQSYGNCGVELTRLFMAKNGESISENALLQESIDAGDAADEPALSQRGGTKPDQRQRILARHGIPSEQVDASTETIAEAVGDGRGVIVSVDAGLLWDNPQYLGGGHVVAVVGAEYDENGVLQSYRLIDTGRSTGQCTVSVPVDKLKGSLRTGPKMNVTRDPIWNPPTPANVLLRLKK